MIREIMRDETFLAKKAEPATPEDLPAARDLLDTPEANKERCVGMAANMIGAGKRIIVFDNEGTYMVMFNPEIIKRSGPYQAEEGCLSLEGARPAKGGRIRRGDRGEARPVPSGKGVPEAALLSAPVGGPCSMSESPCAIRI